ncbi:MAG: hypothetical protein Q9162_001691 [Coniocarpon cinnabarinum]
MTSQSAAVLAALLSLTFLPFSFTFFCRFLGWRLREGCQSRRQIIVERTLLEREQAGKKSSKTPSEDDWEKVDRSRSHSATREDADNDFDGIIGFFHPFCNAGGGGERVLWAAVRATQQRYPSAICVVYTGDHDVNKAQMIKRVQERFNIPLESSSLHFLYPTTRSYVLPQTWPRFTLLGQSFGSLILAYDALSLLTPDIFIDTMGYAFALFLCKSVLPDVPCGAYVHYPTISTDMLDSLNVIDVHAGKGGIHAGRGTGWRGQAKRVYWRIFAALYSWAGGHVDVVMTNSTWTQGHITQLWSKVRTRRNPNATPIEVVFPPCAVDELEDAVEVSAASEARRTENCVYIAQFRPEKNHQMVLRAFARLLQALKIPSPNSSRTNSPSKQTSANDATRTTGEEYDKTRHPHLTLIGSVRDSTDETYIYSLRLLAHELHITHAVTFLLNASWPSILDQLRTATIGLNAMWNEHFGIGVVEYQAAGLISVVNDSGGPKLDIAKPMHEDGDGGTGLTGFHASDEKGYADALEKALTLPEEEKLRMRMRARRSAKGFGERPFEERWLRSLSELVKLRLQRHV